MEFSIELLDTKMVPVFHLCVKKQKNEIKEHIDEERVKIKQRHSMKNWNIIIG